MQNANPWGSGYQANREIKPTSNAVDFIGYRESPAEGMPSIKTVDGRIGYFLPVPYRIGAGAAWQADAEKVKQFGGVPYTATRKNGSVAAQMTGRVELEKISGYFFKTEPPLSSVANYVEWKESSFLQNQGLALGAIVAAPFVVPIIAGAVAPSGVGVSGTGLSMSGGGLGVKMPTLALEGGTIGVNSGVGLSLSTPTAASTLAAIGPTSVSVAEFSASEIVKSAIKKIPTSFSELKETTAAVNVAAGDIGKTAAGIASLGAGVKAAITGEVEKVDNPAELINAIDSTNTVDRGAEITLLPVAAGLGLLSLLFFI